MGIKNRQGDLPLHVAARNTALEPDPERLSQGLPSAAEEIIVHLLEANANATQKRNELWRLSVTFGT